MGAPLRRAQPHQTRPPRLSRFPGLKPLHSHRYLDGLLGRDIIHSVTNPLDKLSYALHVYDGDFLSAEGKSCWDAETLIELPYDAALVSPMFGRALASR